MDIFFSGSIRGGRSDRALYARFIELLGEYGTVLTEHIGEDNVEQKEAEQGLTDEMIHDQDVAWLRQADVVIAEVTTPSLGVGYEVGRAVALDKPVCCCYRVDGEHELSAMIRGNDAVTVTEYEHLDELTPVLAEFCETHS